MISHRHRYIYIKVPKCASSSVRVWLLAHGGARHVYPPGWYPGTVETRIVPTATAIALYPGYFTFTFLRNPYRRFVSAYLNANRYARRLHARHAHTPLGHRTVREFAELCAELLADTRHLWGRQAAAFGRRHADRRYGPRGHRLRHLWFVAVHARPQVDFLPDCNPERLFGVPRPHPAPLSFIGTVETLDADFRRLRELLGLPPSPLPRRNASAPAPEAFEALRRDAATRRLVEALYAQDFAFAGYPLGELDGRAAALQRRRTYPAPLPGAGERVAPATRARRAGLALSMAEIALEARVRRTPMLGRLCGLLARLRRRLALASAARAVPRPASATPDTDARP